MRIAVITLWSLLFCGASCWLIRRYAEAARIRRHSAFYAGLVMTAFFLMLRQSAIVWRIVPLLKLMQFPHRLNVFVVLAEAALAALAFATLRKGGFRLLSAVICLSLMGWGLADIASARQAFSSWRNIPPARAERAAGLLRTQQEYFSFWPKPAKVMEYLAIPQLERFITLHPPKHTELTGAAAQGTALVRRWNAREVLLDVTASGDGQLTLNHFYMDGWRARIAGTRTSLALVPSSPDALISVHVPAGSYRLVVDLPPDPAERAGKLISFLSLAVLGLITIWTALGNFRRRLRPRDSGYRAFARAASTFADN
jgi:hypothetical protein